MPREPLLKGKVQSSLPPFTNQFRSAAFDYANIIYFLQKQATQMKGATELCLPLQLVFSAQPLTKDRKNLSVIAFPASLKYLFIYSYRQRILWYFSYSAYMISIFPTRLMHSIWKGYLDTIPCCWSMVSSLL